MQMEHPFGNNTLAMINDTSSLAALPHPVLQRKVTDGQVAEEEDPKPRRPMTSYNVFFKVNII